MSNNYWDKVKEVLFKYSNEEQDLNKARSEWFYYGEVEDNKLIDTSFGEEVKINNYPNCELCNHPHIRHSFSIKNKENDNKLKIGCECVTKFIEVDKEGNIIRDPIKKKKELKKDVRKLVKNKKTQIIINNILAIKKNFEEFDEIGFLGRLDEKNGFTINEVKYLIIMFKKYGIKYDITNYRLRLRKDREKQQLFALIKWQFENLKQIIPLKFQEEYLLRKNN